MDDFQIPGQEGPGGAQAGIGIQQDRRGRILMGDGLPGQEDAPGGEEVHQTVLRPSADGRLLRPLPDQDRQQEGVGQGQDHDHHVLEPPPFHVRLPSRRGTRPRRPHPMPPPGSGPLSRQPPGETVSPGRSDAAPGPPAAGGDRQPRPVRCRP